MSYLNPSLALNLTSVPSIFRPFNCKLCYWLSFSNVSELKQHNEYFHPKPFKCDKCFETSFVKLDDLNLHMERFHPKKFQCNLCFAVYAEYADLKGHIDLGPVISYSKSSNCHRILKLLSNFEYFVVFWYLDRANSIEIDLHNCNLHMDRLVCKFQVWDLVFDKLFKQNS